MAFDLVKYTGAAYLVFLGLRALLDRGQARPAAASAPVLRPARAYWRAVVTNVLNPKVALFFLALLPQFVHVERGHVALQFAVLGAIVGAMGLVFGSLLALAASTVSEFLRGAAVARWQERITGGVLLALGVRLALESRD